MARALAHTHTHTHTYAHTHTYTLCGGGRGVEVVGKCVEDGSVQVLEVRPETGGTLCERVCESVCDRECVCDDEAVHATSVREIGRARGGKDMLKESEQRRACLFAPIKLSCMISSRPLPISTPCLLRGQAPRDTDDSRAAHSLF